ncbi:PIN domain-containing protein [Curtobacterium sp. SP.BCp]|uniref:PIN domain-containing protein n=1 Tax=Curtobacterium sp. SP.BCp TaxID=3435230 RepID=UPI003F73B64F
MILVLDANAVVPNPELQGSAWKDITTAIRDGALSVVVPKIVAAEITGTVQKNRRDQRPKGDVHRAPEAVQQSVQDAADEVERWAESYDATIYLEAEGVTIRDTPTVTHDEVAQRAIDRGRPFNEKGGGYRDALHADLRAEMEAVLTTGTITLCTTLKEFVPPQKYAGDEDRVFPEAEHLSELVTALFPDGKLHAPELWIALDLGDPVDADVSEPGTPELVWSFARELVDGGRSYRTRIRMTARVAFDWIDWPDDDNEGSYQDLDITAWYTVDDEGFHIDQDRTNLQPAPVYTPPRRTEDTSTLTSTAFSLWREQQAATLAAVRALGTPSDIAALSAELARRAAAGINIVTPGTIAAMNVELARHAGVGIKAAAALNSAALGAELSRQVIDAGRAAQLGSELSRRAAAGIDGAALGSEITRRAAETVRPAESSPEAPAKAEENDKQPSEQGPDSGDIPSQ